MGHGIRPHQRGSCPRAASLVSVNSENWLTDAPLNEWYGVETDASGRVTGLQLAGRQDRGSGSWIRHGLEGGIPPELTDLTQLTRLDLSANELTGPLPPELGGLAGLESLDLSSNDFSGPIPPELGGLASLDSLDLSGNSFSGSLPPELGGLASLQHLDLSSNLFSGPIPLEFAGLTSLESLYLTSNLFSGPIPPEFGGLTSLESLVLSGNRFSGPIPPELGGLASLEHLNLDTNTLTGPIPPELGNLGSLVGLILHSNDLTGPIPPELANLGRLYWLDLSSNNLTGSIPPELGDLANLGRLNLNTNDLAGPVPLQVGRLSRLQELDLSNNMALAGALPVELTDLSRIETIFAGGTGLCAPRNPVFEAWLAGVRERWIARCVDVGSADAYLTQAVQSREFPVPLVAGDEALLRVFMTAVRATDVGIPDVRARFYRDGRETHAVAIPGTAAPIPTEVTEGELAASANAEIPGHVIQPGIELVIEVDPHGTLDPGLGVARRIPETGRLGVDVEVMPLFDLTLIPFVWSETQDSSVVDLVRAMAADPENHDMLEHTRTLLPVGDLAVTAHPPVVSSSNSAFDLLGQTEVIRVMEGGDGHYKGMMTSPVTGAGGVARLSGRSSFSQPNPATLAHELGHNFSLLHAPCGRPSGVDRRFPHPDGSIGAWGFDFRQGGRLKPPSTPDLMSYCGPKWTSDYHFTKALAFRLVDEGGDATAPATTRSLLVWGGMDADSVPFLEPAFVVEAPPVAPHSDGDYELTGRDASGRDLFSLSFAMPVALSEEAEVSSFVFALPVQPGWADALASITLSGTAGTATLDDDSDIPMAILRDPRTGRVRGFLRDVGDPEAGALARSVGGLDVLFSRGIPGASAWRR